MFVRTYKGSHRFGNRSQFIKTVAKSDLLETKSARMNFGIAAAGMERIQIPAGQRLRAIAIETGSQAVARSSESIGDFNRCW